MAGAAHPREPTGGRLASRGVAVRPLPAGSRITGSHTLN